MRFIGKVKRFFRSRQLIAAYDSRYVALSMPNRAEITEIMQHGPMVFVSMDISDVPRSEKMLFLPVEAPQPAQLPPAPTNTLKKGGGPQA